MKFRCSKCFEDLKHTKYDLGIFVEECENCKVDVEVIEEESYDNGFDDGVLEESEKKLDVLDSLNNVLLDIAR